MRGALYMPPVGELVAAGFERARVARFVREQAATAAAYAARGNVDAEAAAVFVRWASTLAEMVDQGLYDGEIS